MAAEAPCFACSCCVPFESEGLQPDVLTLKKRADQEAWQTRHSTCGYRSLLPTLGAGGRNLRQKPCSLLPSPCVRVKVNSCIQRAWAGHACGDEHTCHMSQLRVVCCGPVPVSPHLCLLL